MDPRNRFAGSLENRRWHVDGAESRGLALRIRASPANWQAVSKFAAEKLTEFAQSVVMTEGNLGQHCYVFL